MCSSDPAVNYLAEQGSDSEKKVYEESVKYVT